MAIKTNLIKKPNTWCVLEKCGHLLLEVEKLGYPINIFDLLDGSVGKRWSNYRKDKTWKVDISTAIYHLDSHRGTREIVAYDFCELGYFANWLETTYEIQNLPVYLHDKYGGLVKV
jgi:hypothetical protein